MRKPQPDLTSAERERITWPSGASRHKRVAGETDRHPRYDLVSPIGHRRLAEVYGEGASKFGDRNWEHGMPEAAILNHLEAHLVQWKAGDCSEDHLAKAAWGLYALMHYEERGTPGCDCSGPCEPGCKRYPVREAAETKGCRRWQCRAGADGYCAQCHEALYT